MAFTFAQTPLQVEASTPRKICMFFSSMTRTMPFLRQGAWDRPRGVLVEISPVLLFGRDEYMAHGRHTALESYTFVWRDGRRGEKAWALALGLGAYMYPYRVPGQLGC